MEEFKNLFDALSGKNEPTFYDCIIVVTKYNGAYLIKSDPGLEDAFDGQDLDDNLTDTTNLPSEPGVYKCQIRYHGFESHHPLDPVEWDVNVSIVYCEPIII